MFLPALMPQNGPYILQNPFIAQNSPYMPQSSPLGPRPGPYKTRSFSSLRGQENIPPLGAPFVHRKLAPLVHQTSAPFVAQNLALSANQQPAPFVTTQLVPFVTAQLVPFVVNQAPLDPRFSPYKKPAYPHPQDQDNAPLPTSFVDRKSVPLVNEHPTPFVDQKTSLRVDQNSHICVDRTGRLFDDRSPSSYADLDLSCPRSEDKLATFKSLGLGWPSSTPLGHPFEIPGPQLRKSNALESHGYHHHDQPSGSHPHEHSSGARDHGYHPYKQPSHSPGPQPRKPSALHSIQAHVQQNLKPAAGRAVRYTTPTVVYAPAGAAHVPFVASTGSSWEDEAEKSMYDGAPTDDAALPTVGFDVASWSWGGPARSEGDSGIEDSGAVPGDNSTHKDDASSHGVIFTTHDPTTADTAPSSAERITSSSAERTTFLCYRPRRKSIKKAFKILDGLGLPIVDRSKGAARGDERKAGRGDERKAASRANVKMSCDGMADRSKGMADRSRAADGAGVKRVFCGGGKMDCDDLDCDVMDCDGGHSDKATYNTTDAYGYAAFDARLADLESCEAFEKDIDAALAGCVGFDALSGCASWGEVEGEVGSFDALAGCANFDLAHKGARSCEGEHSVTSWEGEAAMSLWEDELKSVWDDELESFWDDGEEGGEMDGAQEGAEMADGGARDDDKENGEREARDDGGEREERRGQEREENGDEGGDGGEGGDGCAGGGSAGGEGGEGGDDGDGKNSKQGSGDRKEEDSQDQDQDHREDQDEDHREDEDEDHRKDEGEDHRKDENDSASEEDQNSAEHKTKERQPARAPIPFSVAFPFHADSALPSVNPSAPNTSASPIPRPQPASSLPRPQPASSLTAALDAWHDLDRNPEASWDARLDEWYAPLRG